MDQIHSVTVIISGSESLIFDSSIRSSFCTHVPLLVCRHQVLTWLNQFVNILAQYFPLWNGKMIPKMPTFETEITNHWPTWEGGGRPIWSGCPIESHLFTPSLCLLQMQHMLLKCEAGMCMCMCVCGRWRSQVDAKGRFGQVDPSMTRSHKLTTEWTNREAEEKNSL